LITSLVDYPDDDEEDEEDGNEFMNAKSVEVDQDIIPSSPAKKQRISSS